MKKRTHTVLQSRAKPTTKNHCVFSLVGIAALICAAAFIIAAAFAVRGAYADKSAPLLNIVVRESGWLVFTGERKYYAVWENGALRRCDVFKPNDETESFFVDEGHDGSSELSLFDKKWERVNDASSLYGVTRSISALLKERPNADVSDIVSLRLLGGRYFVNVFYEGGAFLPQFTNVIYEYIPTENRLSQIVKFYGKNIEHIELYTPRGFKT